MPDTSSRKNKLGSRNVLSIFSLAKPAGCCLMWVWALSTFSPLLKKQKENKIFYDDDVPDDVMFQQSHPG